MPAALEVGLQPDADHALDEFFAEQIGRETEDVGIIVPAAHLGSDAVVARGSADAGDLVRRDAHADAGPADKDATVHTPLTDGLGHLESVIGIIDAFRD